VPLLVPELHHVWVRHLDVLSEVDIHFPVSAVIGSVVEQELECGSVPDVVVALGDCDGVLGEVLDDPGSAVGLVALPQHGAAGHEAGSDHADLLRNGAIVESNVVSGGPVISTLAPPLALDSEALGESVDEGVRNSLGETREEVKTGVTFPGEGPVEVGESVVAKAFATGTPLVLTVAPTKTVTVGSQLFVVQFTEQMPREVNSVFVLGEIPVAVNNGGFLVPPVSWEILTIQNTEFPVVAGDFDAWFPEFDVLVDVGSVGAASFDLSRDKKEDTVNWSESGQGTLKYTLTSRYSAPANYVFS